MPTYEEMKFDNTYKSKMKNQESFFDTSHKSYIANGAEALNDHIHGGASRNEVIEGAKANLVRKMDQINQASQGEAEDWRERNNVLRAELTTAISRVKEASRLSEKLKLKAEIQRGRETGEQDIANNYYNDLTNRRDNLGNELSQEEVEKKNNDNQELENIKNNYIGENGNFFGNALRAMRIWKHKSEEINAEAQEKEQLAQEEIAHIKAKAIEWNQKRKNIHETSIKAKYREFDKMAAAYRVLSRDTGINLNKNVQEYVGQFNFNLFNTKLDSLVQNPYLTVDVQSMLVNKKNNVIENGNYIKSHKRILLVSEPDENGLRTRYKLNGDFQGYMAKRQYDPNRRNRLVSRNNVDKRLRSADEFRLNVDEKDAGGELQVNSQHNVEIQQLKVGKMFHRRTVNGVVLGGMFISSDENAGILEATDRMKEKERIRRQVLKASIFREINSKTIQHAMGYGAESSSDDAKEKIIKKLAKEIMSEKGLEGWTGEVKDNLEDQIEVVKNTLFSEAYDNAITDQNNRVHELENATVKAWEDILKGDNEEEKKNLPDAAKTKVVYDVIRQEYNADNIAKNQLEAVDTRIGKVLDAVKDNKKVLTDVALMLLSNNEITDYWEMAKTICSKFLMTTFEKKTQKMFNSRYNRALAKARGNSGQLMRIALIDELKKDRSHFNADNPLGDFRPTRYKQYIEDWEGKRGTGAALWKRVINGTLASEVGNLAAAGVGVIEDGKLLDGDSLDTARMIRAYSTFVGNALDLGIITETAGYVINDKLSEDTDKRGSIRYTITTYAMMVKNLVKIVKAGIKWYKDHDKVAERKKKGDPSYDPKEQIGFTKANWYKFVSSAMSIIAGTGKAFSKYLDKKEVGNYFGMAKGAIDLCGNILDGINAHYRMSHIQSTLDEFKSAFDNNNPADADMLNVLKNNSQLQYGLALAKGKSKEDRTNAIISGVTNAGKLGISAASQFAPGWKANPIFYVGNYAWDFIMGGVQTVTNIVRHKKGIKSSVAKMLGDKFKNADKSVLDEVLRREAGIVSSDYLKDLARIFMSINTHMFMKNADSEAKKSVGEKIAKALFSNTAITKDKLGKIKVSSLMDAMGVQGNFHGILKHALA